MSVMQEKLMDIKALKKSKSYMATCFPKLWPYVRLLRANEYCAILSYYPYTWSLLLAAKVSSLSFLHTVFYLALLLVINYLYAGTAASINDAWDMNLDRKVHRCKSRPVAAGEISRKTAVMIYIGLQISYLLLGFHMNPVCQKLIMATVIPLFFQPMSKRLIGFPSLTFGILVSWGVFVSWALVMNNLEFIVCGPLYFGAVCWSVFYETIYGAQDKEGDAASGQLSTTLTFGSNSKILLTVTAVGTIAGITLAGENAGMEWPFYLGMLACFLQLIYQIFNVDLDSPEICAKMFNEHTIFGLMVFLAMVAGSGNIFCSIAAPFTATLK